MQVVRRAYPVEVYTATHHIVGTYDPIGSITTAINTPGTTCFPVADATFAPLVPGSPLRPISVPRLTVNKAQILFVAFLDDTAAEDMTLFPRAERIIVYMPGFVLRGEFHLGAEDQVSDFADVVRGSFQPMTDVTIVPLCEIQANLRAEHDLLMVNIRAMQHYHVEDAS
jgi:hypothetical protein